MNKFHKHFLFALEETQGYSADQPFEGVDSGNHLILAKWESEPKGSLSDHRCL